MPKSHDFNRPQTIKRHGVTGQQVIQFKDEPGVYYGLTGQKVEDSVASEAGFDLEADRRRAKALEVMRDAERKAKEILDGAQAESAKLHERAEQHPAVVASAPQSTAQQSAAAEDEEDDGMGGRRRKKGGGGR